MGARLPACPPEGCFSLLSPPRLFGVRGCHPCWPGCNNRRVALSCRRPGTPMDSVWAWRGGAQGPSHHPNQGHFRRGGAARSPGPPPARSHRVRPPRVWACSWGVPSVPVPVPQQPPSLPRPPPLLFTALGHAPSPADSSRDRCEHAAPPPTPRRARHPYPHPLLLLLAAPPLHPSSITPARLAPSSAPGDPVGGGCAGPGKGALSPAGV